MLLQDALQAVASRLNELPPDLIESCNIVSAQLRGELSTSDQEILADDIDYFLASIPAISQAISSHLVSTGHLITTLLSSGSETDISKLVSLATELHDSIPNQSTSISLTRSQITNLTTTLHSTYTLLLEHSIRLLEQTLHGSIARGTRSKAEHLSTVAKGLELKLSVMALTDPSLTDPGMLGELEGYRDRLAGRAEELSEQVAQNERTLGEYGRAGKGMLEIARRFVEARSECQAVREEIARLEARRSDVD